MHGNGPYPFESNEAYAKAEAMAQAGAQTAGMCNQASAVSERSRHPRDVSDELCRAASKYHPGTLEYRLLADAAELLLRQEAQIHADRTRADRAERHSQSVSDKIHLALLALRSPIVD